MTQRTEILISEVGPRDGLQGVARTMPDADKFRWITALCDTGLREIEVCSFVPANLLPQMADAAQVVAHALSLSGLTVTALATNLRGAQAALAASVQKLTNPVAASAAHSLANVRKTREQMVDEVRAIITLKNDIAPMVMVEAGMSTAFGCTLQGDVAEDGVVRLADDLVAAGVYVAGLFDTTGYANPAQVQRLFRGVHAEIGDKTGAAHMHKTRGLGLANCVAAYEADARAFDSSLGGLEECPYTPGASGNVVTEDLVFMFEAMGVSTGVDLNALIRAREALKAGLQGELIYGMTLETGLPKAFHQSSIDRQRAMTNQTIAPPSSSPLPLAGIRVVEFTHMVMGPTCGMVLGDFGAEVIKVEPIGGDNTRNLLGLGAGFFAMFNRNKKSVALDLHKPEGKEAALKLIATADVVSENFKPGTMQKLGLDYVSLSKRNDRLVYISHKGFLPGPCDHRTALDQVVQMMGGLTYMTGRPGDPLRAGASVNDLMGGMFGAIGAMAALIQRAHTGKVQEVQSALFENNVFLVAQHMMQFAITATPAAPTPGRYTPYLP